MVIPENLMVFKRVPSNKNKMVIIGKLVYEYIRKENGYRLIEYKDSPRTLCIQSKIFGIPVTSISEKAFDCDEKFDSIYFNGTTTDWCKILLPYPGPTFMTPHFYFKNDGKYYREIEKLVVPGTIDELYCFAFSGIKTLKKVTIMEGLTIVGDSAFYGCDSLEEVILPKSVKDIGYHAFQGCVSLKNAYFEGTVSDWCGITFYDHFSTPACYSLNFYLKDENGNFIEPTEIKIPDGSYEVSNIAFNYLRKLTKVEIPSSIQLIGYAFEGCKNLKDVYYAGTLSQWLEIEIDGSLMKYAEHFYCMDYNGNYSELTELTIPGSIGKVPYNSFNGFKNLKKVVIEEGIFTIEEGAFSGCSGLTEIVLPESLLSIMWKAFSFCSKLESITIPSGVLIIDDKAFLGCENLKQVIFKNPTDWFLYDNNIAKFNEDDLDDDEDDIYPKYKTALIKIIPQSISNSPEATADALTRRYLRYQWRHSRKE